jgi:hypothetical protein
MVISLFFEALSNLALLANGSDRKSPGEFALNVLVNTALAIWGLLVLYRA